MVLLSPRTSPKLTSLHFRTKQNHFHRPTPLLSSPLFRLTLMCDSHLLWDFDSGQGTWRGKGSLESYELRTGIPKHLRAAKTWNSDKLLTTGACWMQALVRNNRILVFCSAKRNSWCTAMLKLKFMVLLKISHVKKNAQNRTKYLIAYNSCI